MSRIARIWLAVLALALGLAPRASRADAALQLHVEPGALPADALRALLERELGFPLALVTEPGPGLDSLSVRRAQGQVLEVSLETRDGVRAVREAPLLDNPEEAVEATAFIAANLLRNEAEGLLAELAARAAPRTAAPVAAPPAEPAPAPVEACALPVTQPFGADLVPGVGSSSTARGRRAVRGLSLGLVGTLSRGMRGAELAAGFNLQTAALCGFQLAGGANLVLGPMQGVSLAQFNLVTGGVRGLMAAVLNVGAGPLRGAQLGVANGAGGPLRGLQLGVVNFSLRELAGAQLGVANIGLAHVHGLQLGVANYAGRNVRGLQLGVVNVAERGAQLGVVSVARKGRTSVDVLGTETGLLMAGAVHGGSRLHNAYYVGARTGAAGPRFAFGLGLGVRALNRPRLLLDVDVLSQHVLRSDWGEPSIVAAVRVPLTIMLVGRLGLLVAPSYSFLFTSHASERSQAPFGQSELRGGKHRIESWPGATLGLRYDFAAR